MALRYKLVGMGLGLAAIYVVVWAVHQGALRGLGLVRASVCDLRNKPGEFAGRLVETQGWLYTDLESSSLHDGGCGLLVDYPDQPEQTLHRDAQLKQFEDLVVAVQKGSWNTNDEVFVVLQGRFETIPTTDLTNEKRRIPGFGVHASIPSRLVIERVTCSAVAPTSKYDRESARAMCSK